MKPNKTSSKAASNSKNKSKEAEVLYQKMGDRVFAFSMIDDEVFIGSISSEELHASASPVADVAGSSAERARRTFKITGNS